MFSIHHSIVGQGRPRGGVSPGSAPHALQQPGAGRDGRDTASSRRKGQAGRGRDAPHPHWAFPLPNLPKPAGPGQLDWRSGAAFLLPRDPSRDWSQARHQGRQWGVVRRRGTGWRRHLPPRGQTCPSLRAPRRASAPPAAFSKNPRALLPPAPWHCSAPASPLLHGPREPAGASPLPRVRPGLEHRGRRGFGGAAFARRECRAERAALPLAPCLKMPWEEAREVSEPPGAAPRTTALFAEKQHPARADPSGVPAPLPLLFALLRRGVCLQYDSLRSLFTVSQPLPSRSFSFVNPRVLSLPNLDDKAFQAGTVSFLISLKCQPLLTVLDKYLMIIIELDSNNAQPHLHFLSPFRHRLIN